MNESRKRLPNGDYYGCYLEGMRKMFHIHPTCNAHVLYGMDQAYQCTSFHCKPETFIREE